MKKMTKLVCAVALGCAGIMLSVAAHAAVTDQDKSFLAKASQGDINEIKLSELAETKTTNPQVKAFAHKMVVEHKAIEIRMTPFAEAWSLTPPASMDADHQDEWNKLNGLSGAEFDKEYIGVMDKDHHEALDLFTEEAKSTTDMKFKTAVMHCKSVVAAHVIMADDLNKKLS
jgi:putative membrane protein